MTLRLVLYAFLLKYCYCNLDWNYLTNYNMYGEMRRGGYGEQQQYAVQSEENPINSSEETKEENNDSAQCSCMCASCSGPEGCCQVLCTECRVNQPNMIFVPYAYPVLVQGPNVLYPVELNTTTKSNPGERYSTSESYPVEQYTTTKPTSEPETTEIYVTISTPEITENTIATITTTSTAKYIYEELSNFNTGIDVKSETDLENDKVETISTTANHSIINAMADISSGEKPKEFDYPDIKPKARRSNNDRNFFAPNQKVIHERSVSVIDNNYDYPILSASMMSGFEGIKQVKVRNTVPLRSSNRYPDYDIKLRQI